jgi:3-hydroxyisobutyrate dehydrogenase-like beta-hydroxyacid dehydrogenase
MGKALAASLVAAGHEVTVWDHDTAKVATTAMLGASSGLDARHVARSSDVVLTALPHAEAVLEVALGPETGILGGLAEGAVLVDMTTAGPDLAARLDTEFIATGRRFVDAPVSGKAPRMSVLLGAREGEFGEVERVLRDVSTSVVFCGSRGHGYAAKLVNQHVKYGWFLASCEALLVGRRHGLDPAVAVEAVRRSSGATGGFTDAAAYFLADTPAICRHGPARTIAKDMALAEEMARSTEVPVPVLEAVVEFFARAVAGDHADRPYPMSAELLEEAARGTRDVTDIAGEDRSVEHEVHR